MIQILIDNGGGLFCPVALDKVTWSLERQGTPGKLTFSIRQDATAPFTEGNRVRLLEDGAGLFFGYIFDRKPGKDGVMSVTAYDQLRYLKNKDTYVYENKTASEVIQMIADDFRLTVGELEDTRFKIAARSEPDKTLFDIILSALDLTMISTKELFIFYDDYGSLTLRNVASLKLDTAIRTDTAEDYDYTTSIDGDTYNQIKVSVDNEASGKRDIYMVNDSVTMNDWGVLQYYHKAEKGENGRDLAETLLKRYNHKTKKLSIKGAFGDSRVRAGCLIPVILKLEDTALNHYMLAEKVTHTWEGNLHTMDLSLRGCDFVA